jgi:hypothetical protein
METLEEFLEHHGVKGMKWGVRRSNPSGSSSSSSHPSSEDAKRAKASAAIAKTHGTHALSNQDLQHLVSRTDLEQRYSKLSTKNTNAGAKIAKEILLNVGKQQATQVLIKSAGKIIK